MTSHHNTPLRDKQESEVPRKNNNPVRPPTWCIIALGGCWIAGVSLLAHNTLVASKDKKNEASSSYETAYMCGDDSPPPAYGATYMVSTEGKKAPAANDKGSALAKEGKTTYDTYCVACHQPDGIGKAGFAPAIRNPDFLALSSDDFIRTAIKKGRLGTAMTPWAMLKDEQIDGIIAYLRTAKGTTQVKGKVDDARKITGDANAGATLFKTYCASCHGDKGVGYLSGGSGPGIGLKGFLDTASDDYIYQTMKYGRVGTSMRPMLGATGLANLTDAEAFNIISYLRSLNKK